MTTANSVHTAEPMEPNPESYNIGLTEL